MTSIDSFGSRSTLTVGSASYEIFRIDAVPGSARLPFTHKVLLENLLRTEDGANVTRETISALGDWDASAQPSEEIQFTPARVIMQDFTGVPVVVDLATMREAVKDLGGDPAKIEPLARFGYLAIGWGLVDHLEQLLCAALPRQPVLQGGVDAGPPHALRVLPDVAVVVGERVVEGVCRFSDL